MLGYEIQRDTFSGIAGVQETANVYKAGRFVKGFTWPFAHSRAVFWVLTHFWRG